MAQAAWLKRHGSSGMAQAAWLKRHGSSTRWGGAFAPNAPCWIRHCTEMKQGRSSTTAAVPVYFSLFTFLQYQRKEMELDTLIAQVNA